MMGRKLTEKEKEERIVERIFNRIKTIESEYGTPFTKKACVRFAFKRNAESKLAREIAEREEELNKLKTQKR